MTQTPILAYPKFGTDAGVFILDTDASDVGIPAILKQDGCVIAYISCTISSTVALEVAQLNIARHTVLRLNNIATVRFRDQITIQFRYRTTAHFSHDLFLRLNSDTFLRPYKGPFYRPTSQRTTG